MLIYGSIIVSVVFLVLIVVGCEPLNYHIFCRFGWHRLFWAIGHEDSSDCHCACGAKSTGIEIVHTHRKQFPLPKHTCVPLCRHERGKEIAPR